MRLHLRVAPAVGGWESGKRKTRKVRRVTEVVPVEGKTIRLRAVAYEKGGVTTPLEERPAIRYLEKVIGGLVDAPSNSSNHAVILAFRASDSGMMCVSQEVREHDPRPHRHPLQSIDLQR